MGRILANWRIVFAAIFSIGLMCAAYALTRSVGSAQFAQASTEAALLQAIATKDSDGDGLYDWEEALYGTDSAITDSHHLGMTDGEAVAKGLIVPRAIANLATATSSGGVIVDPSLPPAPSDGTLTSAFAEEFMKTYLSMKQSGGADLTDADVASIVDEMLSSLSTGIVAAPDFKNADDLKISGTGNEALQAFAASAEAVFLQHKSDAPKSELFYLQDVVEKNDTAALGDIAAIAKSYRETAAGLAALTVPQELSSDALALINAMMRAGEITSDFARVNDDPLAAILALRQHVTMAKQLAQALANMGAVYERAGVVVPEGAPGALFIQALSVLPVLSEAGSDTP